MLFQGDSCVINQSSWRQVELQRLWPSVLRSARLPVTLIGSPINYANCLIGTPITSQSTALAAQHVCSAAMSSRACTLET